MGKRNYLGWNQNGSPRGGGDYRIREEIVNNWLKDRKDKRRRVLGSQTISWSKIKLCGREIYEEREG